MIFASEIYLVPIVVFIIDPIVVIYEPVAAAVGIAVAGVAFAALAILKIIFAIPFVTFVGILFHFQLIFLKTSSKIISTKKKTI